MNAAVVVKLHVAALDVDDATLRELSDTLGEAERRRADALRDVDERRRFVADHGYRRRLLAAAIDGDPAALQFVIDPGGKPRLSPGTAAAGGVAPPRFSASRARDVALYAVCTSAEVGVDIERVRSHGDPSGLPTRLMSPGEHERWRALPEHDRAAALYAVWSRKEAYGKALGDGLIFPLSGIEAWAGDARPLRHGDVEIRTISPADLAAALGETRDEGRCRAAAVAVRTGAGDHVSIAAPALVV